MNVSEIQCAVAALPPEERTQLTAWMVSRYPVRNVEQLMRHAANLVDGDWAPDPPTEDNWLDSDIAEYAREVAEHLTLAWAGKRMPADQTKEM